ncbi:hypothetical protein MMC25_008212 [Agyrium rufum]|nr:hypothetical protein [Agyrium rufum]
MASTHHHRFGHFLPGHKRSSSQPPSQPALEISGPTPIADSMPAMPNLVPIAQQGIPLPDTMPSSMPTSQALEPLKQQDGECPDLSKTDKFRVSIGLKPKCPCRNCKDKSPAVAASVPPSPQVGYQNPAGNDLPLHPNPAQLQQALPQPAPIDPSVNRNEQEEVLPIYIRDDTAPASFPQHLDNSEADTALTPVESPAESNYSRGPSDSSISLPMTDSPTEDKPQRTRSPSPAPVPQRKPVQSTREQAFPGKAGLPSGPGVARKNNQFRSAPASPTFAARPVSPDRPSARASSATRRRPHDSALDYYFEARQSTVEPIPPLPAAHYAPVESPAAMAVASPQRHAHFAEEVPRGEGEEVHMTYQPESFMAPSSDNAMMHHQKPSVPTLEFEDDDEQSDWEQDYVDDDDDVETHEVPVIADVQTLAEAHSQAQSMAPVISLEAPTPIEPPTHMQIADHMAAAAAAPPMARRMTEESTQQMGNQASPESMMMQGSPPLSLPQSQMDAHTNNYTSPSTMMAPQEDATVSATMSGTLMEPSIAPQQSHGSSSVSHTRQPGSTPGSRSGTSAGVVGAPGGPTPLTTSSRPASPQMAPSAPATAMPHTGPPAGPLGGPGGPGGLWQGGPGGPPGHPSGPGGPGGLWQGGPGGPPGGPGGFGRGAPPGGADVPKNFQPLKKEKPLPGKPINGIQPPHPMVGDQAQQRPLKKLVGKVTGGGKKNAPPGGGKKQVPNFSQPQISRPVNAPIQNFGVGSANPPSYSSANPTGPPTFASAPINGPPAVASAAGTPDGPRSFSPANSGTASPSMASESTARQGPPSSVLTSDLTASPSTASLRSPSAHAAVANFSSQPGSQATSPTLESMPFGAPLGHTRSRSDAGPGPAGPQQFGLPNHPSQRMNAFSTSHSRSKSSGLPTSPRPLHRPSGSIREPRSMREEVPVAFDDNIVVRNDQPGFNAGFRGNVIGRDFATLPSTTFENSAPPPQAQLQQVQQAPPPLQPQQQLPKQQNFQAPPPPQPFVSGQPIAVQTVTLQQAQQVQIGRPVGLGFEVRDTRERRLPAPEGYEAPYGTRFR